MAAESAVGRRRRKVSGPPDDARVVMTTLASRGVAGKPPAGAGDDLDVDVTAFALEIGGECRVSGSHAMGWLADRFPAKLTGKPGRHPNRRAWRPR